MGRPDLENGVYLYGKSGRGKTTAACGALRSYVERHTIEVEDTAFYRGKHCQFVNVPAWFEFIRDSYSLRGVSSMAIIRQYAEAHILILDDLGKGQQTKWTTEKLYMLLDYRCGEGLPTIATSNYGSTSLVNLLDDDNEMKQAIYSRLMQTCDNTCFEIVGKDLRGWEQQ